MRLLAVVCEFVKPKKAKTFNKIKGMKKILIPVRQIFFISGEIAYLLIIYNNGRKNVIYLLLLILAFKFNKKNTYYN